MLSESEDTNMRDPKNIRIHHFDDTSEAYDCSQYRDDIEMGDVLVVESEKVVGFLLAAWPVAVTVEYGSLHRFTNRKPQLATHPEDVRDWRPYYERAKEVAKALGYELGVD